MNYQSLTSQQQSDVAYLFADECFRSDPAAYDYELVSGEIVSRRPLMVVPASRKSDKTADVVIRAEPRITDDRARCAQAASMSLAMEVVRALALAEIAVEAAHAE